MQFAADLHIHSRHSRATSRDMTPESLWRWAQLKGIGVIGTGDLTHPGWLAELDEKLEPAGNGFFSLRKERRTGDVPDPCRGEVHFVLSAEVSCIYRKNGRTRKVHAVVLMPGMEEAKRFNASLAKVGNLNADGRPILGLDAKELLRMALDASPEALYIPAHAWTPHFSVFGAQSGFDSLQECFDELTPHIHAIETGLSSDPPMNWRLSELDKVTLLSNSDAHSPAKLGREANLFSCGVSYAALRGAIVTRKGFEGTIEFFPEEGKYHYDGHRDCEVRSTPGETLRRQGKCPACGKALTIGVLHRAELLADRPEGSRPDGAPGFAPLIPLAEIVAETLDAGVNTKKVDGLYHRLLQELGPELQLLRHAPPADIARVGGPLLGEAVERVRAGKVAIEPGYDGEYGTIRIFHEQERAFYGR